MLRFVNGCLFVFSVTVTAAAASAAISIVVVYVFCPINLSHTKKLNVQSSNNDNSTRENRESKYQMNVSFFRNYHHRYSIENPRKTWCHQFHFDQSLFWIFGWKSLKNFISSIEESKDFLNKNISKSCEY